MERAEQGCSRVRREIPSGLNQQWPETGRIALSSECSYRFVVCMSRVMASRSSRSGRGARWARRDEGVDALLRPTVRRNGCGSSPAKPKAKTSEWAAVTAFFSRRESACRRDSARERVLRRPYPGRRRACSTVEVAHFSLRREAPSNKIRGAGSRVGLGIRHDRLRSYHRVRGARSCVPPPLPCEGEVSRSMARAESDPYRTRVRHRSRPSEERRCLPPHGRANGPCGGRKRRRYVMPPCTGKVVGSLG